MEEQIIKEFNDARQRYDAAEEAMQEYFTNKHRPAIFAAKSIDDLIVIKEALRVMPMCGGKALIFREIILKENELKSQS